MRYGSVCSGIEAATQAWHGLGWTPAFFSDIEKFPVAVLQHHYPDVPCHGDFTTIKDDEYGAIDLLVGGTPCQSFSVAGLRGGMDDDRGNLALEFLRLAQRKTPKWLVWENVPGVLSSKGGRDFGSFLGALAEIGYGFAYRVLDAQYFGVAQRRRRLFVVGYLGDWRRAAAVLFERESLLGNPAPSREEGEKVAPAVTTGPPFSRTGNERVECDAIVPMVNGSHWDDPSNPHPTLNQSHNTGGIGASNQEVFSQRGSGLVPMQLRVGVDPTNGAVTGEVAATMTTGAGSSSGTGPRVLECEAIVPVTGPLTAGMGRGPRGTEGVESNHVIPAVRTFSGNQESPVAGTLETTCHDYSRADSFNMAVSHAVASGLSVRRLTPTECERLQGFPDNFTQIPYRNKPAENCPDGPRYKALGNSMAVPVMRWIGERIQAVEAL